MLIVKHESAPLTAAKGLLSKIWGRAKAERQAASGQSANGEEATALLSASLSEKTADGTAFSAASPIAADSAERVGPSLELASEKPETLSAQALAGAGVAERASPPVDSAPKKSLGELRAQKILGALSRGESWTALCAARKQRAQIEFELAQSAPDRMPKHIAESKVEVEILRREILASCALREAVAADVRSRPDSALFGVGDWTLEREAVGDWSSEENRGVAARAARVAAECFLPTAIRDLGERGAAASASPESHRDPLLKGFAQWRPDGHNQLDRIRETLAELLRWGFVDANDFALALEGLLGGQTSNAAGRLEQRAGDEPVGARVAVALIEKIDQSAVAGGTDQQKNDPQKWERQALRLAQSEFGVSGSAEWTSVAEILRPWSERETLAQEARQAAAEKAEQDARQKAEQEIGAEKIVVFARKEPQAACASVEKIAGAPIISTQSACARVSVAERAALRRQGRRV